MKIFIHNPTDFLREELRRLNYEYNLADYEGYSEHVDGSIELSGEMEINCVEFNGSEKLMITYYHPEILSFGFYIPKSEFTHLEVRL